MRNIFSIPTKNFSKIGFIAESQEYYLYGKSDFLDNLAINVHIYITSGEEIKEEDWCICSEEKIHKVLKIRFDIGIVKFQDGTTEVLKSCRKIVLTTDKDLIKDGVQVIPDEFLEWFASHSSCKFVEVKKEILDIITLVSDYKKYPNLEVFNYKIINPNNQEVMFHEERQEYFYEDIINRKKVSVWLGKDYNQSQYTKQELEGIENFKNTIESNIEKLSINVGREDLFNSIYSIVRKIPIKHPIGDAMDVNSCVVEIENLFYKLQNQRMYSEEELQQKIDSHLDVAKDFCLTTVKEQKRMYSEEDIISSILEFTRNVIGLNYTKQDIIDWLGDKNNKR